jgi:nitroreductase
MDAIEAILTRHSIRKYSQKPISEQDLDTILKAAMSAPSANNKQPWHYVVIEERDLLDRIGEFHRHGKMLHQAQAAILVCGDEKLAKYHGHMVLDCAAATENILIAAHALGLGAVWIGIYPWENRIEAFRKFIDIPQEITPMALVSIGHPDQQKPSAREFNFDRVHRNRW